MSMAEQVSMEEDVKSGLVTRSGIAGSCIGNTVLKIGETKQAEDTVATERNSNYPCWTEMFPSPTHYKPRKTVRARTVHTLVLKTFIHFPLCILITHKLLSEKALNTTGAEGPTMGTEREGEGS